MSSSLLKNLSDSALLQMGSHELNQLFADNSPGEVPVGRTDGVTLLFPGTPKNTLLSRLIYLFVWRGKNFYTDGTMLSNRITALELSVIRAKVSLGRSWVDNKDCIVLDYSRTSFLARGVRDEIRLVAPDLYLGVIWLWRRRIGWFTLRSHPTLLLDRTLMPPVDGHSDHGGALG